MNNWKTLVLDYFASPGNTAGELKKTESTTASVIVFLLAMFTFPLSANPFYAALMFAPLSFGRAVSDPSLQSLVTRFGTDRTRGRLLGIYQSASSMAFIFGPIWGGWAFENIAPSAIYWVGGIIVIPAVTLAYIIRRRPLPVVVEEQAPGGGGGE